MMLNLLVLPSKDSLVSPELKIACTSSVEFAVLIVPVSSVVQLRLIVYQTFPVSTLPFAQKVSSLISKVSIPMLEHLFPVVEIFVQLRSWLWMLITNVNMYLPE